MSFKEFFQYHMPALELDEVRFNVLVHVIAAERNGLSTGLQHWTLGAPGHCAIRSPGRSILLGALDRDECHRLARETSGLAYPGVLGCDGTAAWFVEEAALKGAVFGEIISQRIHTLTGSPRYPGAKGSARTVIPAPVDRFIRARHCEGLQPPKQSRGDIDERNVCGSWIATAALPPRDDVPELFSRIWY